MAAASSADLRQRVVDAYRRGEGTYEELATRFSVGMASVSRWLRRHRETGGVDPRPHAGGPSLLIDGEDLTFLRKVVEAHPDWTETELGKELRAERKVKASDVTVGRAVRRLGYGNCSTAFFTRVDVRSLRD